MTKEYYKNHIWGDKDFDWNGLEEAIDFLCDEMYIRGRMVCSGKEKWGQARIHVEWWDGCFSTFFYKPQRRWHRLHSFEWAHFSHLWLRLFGSYIHKKQEKAYVDSYREACYKYPHLVEELLACAYPYDLLMDLFLEFGLPCPWHNGECEKGNHKASPKDYGDEGPYCKECFRSIKEVTDED